MLQQLKSRLTKLEAATVPDTPAAPQKPIGERIDEAIVLLPLYAWEWVLQLRELRSPTNFPPDSMERQEARGEMAAQFATGLYGLSLGHLPWPKGATWMVGDMKKAIPYLLRCSYRELGVLAPDEREALIEHVRGLIETRGLKYKTELQELTASLADLDLPGLFAPFRKRYARELEKQSQGIALPDMKETDTLEHKRLALGRWFFQQCGTTRRS